MQSSDALTDGVSGPVSPNKKRTTVLTVLLILGNELCERLAYYGIATNLVIYLKQLQATTVGAAVATNVFSGTCYIMPLLFGWIADSFWGRYKTILILSIVYCFGMISLTLSAEVPAFHPDIEADEPANAFHWSILGFSLFLVATGTGGIKPNVSSFGADQFDESDPWDRKAKDSFFNWFYFSINIGAFIASTVIVPIQLHVGWGPGFFIPAVAMFVAILFFVAGTKLYKRLPPSESPISRVIMVIHTALKNKRRAKEQPENAAPLLEAPEDDDDKATAQKESWLDYAEGPGFFRKEQVYEVKLVLGVIPVFLTTIVYWMVYSQITNMFILQGALMNRKMEIFGKNLTVPAATISLFDTLIIIILVPIYDMIIVPLLAKCNAKPTLLQRIGIGYVFAVLAMVAAFFIENRRLHLYKQGESFSMQEGKETLTVVDMSVWWQSIEYALIGASEVLASIGQLEFFYDQAPDVMRSMMMALNLLSVALGGYLAGFVIWVLNKLSQLGGNEWIPDDLNEGRLDLFFLVIAGLMLLVTLIFVYITIKYRYKVLEHEQKARPMDEPTPEDTLHHSRSVAYHGEPNLRPE